MSRAVKPRDPTSNRGKQVARRILAQRSPVPFDAAARLSADDTMSGDDLRALAEGGRPARAVLGTRAVVPGCVG